MPEENLVGGRGRGLQQFFQVLDIGRIGVAAMGVGLAQGALDEALAYAKQRRALARAAFNPANSSADISGTSGRGRSL